MCTVRERERGRERGGREREGEGGMEGGREENEGKQCFNKESNYPHVYK